MKSKKSLANLLSNGWTKHEEKRYMQRGEIQYCLSGGLRHLGLMKGMPILREVISELFPERVEKIMKGLIRRYSKATRLFPINVVMDFNDMRATTKDQVLKVAEEFDRRYPNV